MHHHYGFQVAYNIYALPPVREYIERNKQSCSKEYQPERCLSGADRIFLGLSCE